MTMNDPSTEKPADFPPPQGFPSESAAPAPVVVKSSGTTLRYVLPSVLFVLMVGAIAWVTQFMPNWRADNKKAVPVGPAGAAALKFSLVRALWDPEDEDYALETEKGKDGHFDFPFENTSYQPAELGLKKRSCDCSYLEVCIVPPVEWERYRQEIAKSPVTAKSGDWAWEKIVDSETKGYEVPAGAKGLVRVTWHGRKAPGSRLQLTADMWHQPPGQVGQRRFEKLEVPILMAAPVQFLPTRINIGTIAARESGVADFTLWSATRSTLDFTGADSKDPLFTYEFKPFSPEERRDLEKKLRRPAAADKKGENTRVRAAYRFQVTVQEQASGKQLDQGPFHHDVTFLLDEDKVPGPQVSGMVSGDVIVGNTEERGKVDLKIFRAKQGTTRTVALWANDKIILEPESHTPARLQVHVKKAEKNGTNVKWLLEVTVPPNSHYGPFPEESVIILRIQGTPPRFIRIPVKGNGQA